jgi:DNA-binding XRE family transcriptional regulator
MKKIKSYNYDTVLDKELQNKEFKAAYDSFSEEFSLAKDIIKLRKNNNLTQKELAEKVGTSQPAIARLESGNYKNISLAFLRKVASALGTTPEIKLKRIKQ